MTKLKYFFLFLIILSFGMNAFSFSSVSTVDWNDSLDIELNNGVRAYKVVYIEDNLILHGNMTTFYRNGMSLWGAHYAPYIGNVPFRYDNVAWGFYSYRVSRNAKLCAEFAYQELVETVSKDWPLMRNLVSAHDVSNNILFWINDYSYADSNRKPIFNGFWYWDAGDSVNSTWVWSATYTKDGQCIFSDGNDLDDVVLSVYRSLR